MKKLIKFILLPVVIFVLLQVIFLTNTWDLVHGKGIDILFQTRGQVETSGDIVIAAIDDDTFQDLDISWPFPRSYFAKLIENLVKAEARLIIFDVEFTEASSASEDSIFAAELAKHENVILAGKFKQQGFENTVRMQSISPYKDFRDRAKWGIVNIYPDNDHFVRKYTLYKEYGDEQLYSLSVLGLGSTLYRKNWIKHKHEGRKYFQIDDYLIPKVEKNTTLINYYGPTGGTIPTYSLSHILDDEDFELKFDENTFSDPHSGFLVNETFKNKIVFVGATAEELQDVFATPFSSDGLMPGVEIHANSLEMFLNKNFLYKFPFLYELLAHLLLVYLGYILILYVRPVRSLFGYFILTIGYFIFAFFLFANKSYLIPLFEIPLTFLILYLIGLIYHYVKTAKQRKFIKTAFQHYLAPAVVNELIKNPKNLEYGGSQREISILFSDIRSFTTYTESHKSHEVVAILKEYLTEMVAIIKNNHGTVDKFVGDEIMALIGTPIYMEDHAYVACKIAMEMRLRLNKLHEEWKASGRDIFEIGIGINSGYATVGNLGSEQIFDYTAIGDTVNVAARLEAINKEYETKNHIIISEDTLNMVKDFAVVNFLDDVMVKGKTIPVKIYELVDLKPKDTKD